MQPIEPGPAQAGGWQIQNHGSGLVEQVLEYRFLADLTAELLRRGMRFEVLRGDCDLDGYDLAIEANGVLRHIQLKTLAKDSSTARVPVNTRLAHKPSACIIWMSYDPQTWQLTRWRWLGGKPGRPLPDVGDRAARHSRANSLGIKRVRPEIRMVPKGRFTLIDTIGEIADLLFGTPSDALLRRSLRPAGDIDFDAPWLALAWSGDFTAIPQHLDWDGSAGLAHLIDGYELAEALGHGPIDFADHQLEAARQTGIWPGDAAELWASLFLEHRRWRMSGPFKPDREIIRLLDRLVAQLRKTLVGEGDK